MSWFRTYSTPAAPARAVARTIAVAAVLVTGACGFRPLYQSDANIPGLVEKFSQIKIYNVRARAGERQYDRLGQQMHNLLLDRLNPRGRPKQPAYALRVTVSVSRQETGLRITEEATRALLTVGAIYHLTDVKTGKALFQASERLVNSYNVADSEYATLNAENDAAERAVREISDAIKLRLGIFFKRQQK